MPVKNQKQHVIGRYRHAAPVVVALFSQNYMFLVSPFQNKKSSELTSGTADQLPRAVGASCAGRSAGRRSSSFLDCGLRPRAAAGSCCALAHKHPHVFASSPFMFVSTLAALPTDAAARATAARACANYVTFGGCVDHIQKHGGWHGRGCAALGMCRFQKFGSACDQNDSRGLATGFSQVSIPVRSLPHTLAGGKTT